jgi:hypothetical protein
VASAAANGHQRAHVSPGASTCSVRFEVLFKRVSACPVRVPQRDGCPLWADDDSVSTRARWRVCFLLVPPDPPHTNFPDWVPARTPQSVALLPLATLPQQDGDVVLEPPGFCSLCSLGTCRGLIVLEMISHLTDTSPLVRGLATLEPSCHRLI